MIIVVQSFCRRCWGCSRLLLQMFDWPSVGLLQVHTYLFAYTRVYIFTHISLTHLFVFSVGILPSIDQFTVTWVSYTAPTAADTQKQHYASWSIRRWWWRRRAAFERSDKQTGALSWSYQLTPTLLKGQWHSSVWHDVTWFDTRCLDNQPVGVLFIVCCHIWLYFHLLSLKQMTQASLFNRVQQSRGIIWSLQSYQTRNESVMLHNKPWHNISPFHIMQHIVI